MNTLERFGITRARFAIGESAIAAEDRAIYWQRHNRPGASLEALHDADRLWREALNHIPNDGWTLDKRSPR